MTREHSASTGRSSIRESIRFYSVLIKGGHAGKGGTEDVVEEVFRVQLPGDIMLGEGKPENQNHAMIFSRGEALQTIDMNQCVLAPSSTAPILCICRIFNSRVTMYARPAGVGVATSKRH